MDRMATGHNTHAVSSGRDESAPASHTAQLELDALQRYEVSAFC
jgi:hypothetical protein